MYWPKLKFKRPIKGRKIFVRNKHYTRPRFHCICDIFLGGIVQNTSTDFNLVAIIHVLCYMKVLTHFGNNNMRWN